MRSLPGNIHEEFVKCESCHGKYEFVQRLTIPPPGIHGTVELHQCSYCGNRALFDETITVSGPGRMERFLTWVFGSVFKLKEKENAKL